MNKDTLLCDTCTHKPVCRIKGMYKLSHELVNKTNKNMLDDSPDHIFIRFMVTCDIYDNVKLWQPGTRSKEAKDGEFTNKTIN